MKNLIFAVQKAINLHFENDTHKFFEYVAYSDIYQINLITLPNAANLVIHKQPYNYNFFKIVVRSDNEINFVLTFDENGLNLETFTASFRAVMAQILIVQFSNCVEYCKKRKAFFAQMSI